jgi:hypothetical protein
MGLKRGRSSTSRTKQLNTAACRRTPFQQFEQWSSNIHALASVVKQAHRANVTARQQTITIHHSPSTKQKKDSMNIAIRNDSRRGCGVRRPGGLYLVSDGIPVACGRLPVPIVECPTCHGGIKLTRGWTWIDAGELVSKRNCTAPAKQCMTCPTITGQHGLLTIGGSYYPTPDTWIEEAKRLGVSRRLPRASNTRLPQLPKGFKLGETWVFVAHRKAIPADPPCGKDINALVGGCRRKPGHDGNCSLEREMVPAIFHAFKPTAAEYVVRGDETDEEIAALEKRGITPVKVLVDGVPLGLQAGDIRRAKAPFLL